MKAYIFFPRVDLSFKNFGDPIPKTIGPISPIRRHWLQFLERLELYLKRNNVEVEVAPAKPLWQYTLDEVKAAAQKYDTVFFPHKQKIDFNAGDNVLFYHQTVFPEKFSIDENGWGASISWLNDIDLDSGLNPAETFALTTLKSRRITNASKFDQPARKNLDLDKYVLFVCQLPHDETIKYHSTVSVESALFQTIEYCRENDKFLLVKGHPANPGSMAPLIQIANKYDRARYIENVSIYDCLEFADEIFMVNSGVGFEAMLFENKKILRYGDAEYRNVITNSISEIDKIDQTRRDRFLIRYYNKCF